MTLTYKRQQCATSNQNHEKKKAAMPIFLVFAPIEISRLFSLTTSLMAGVGNCYRLATIRRTTPRTTPSTARHITSLATKAQDRISIHTAVARVRHATAPAHITPQSTRLCPTRQPVQPVLQERAATRPRAPHEHVSTHGHAGIATHTSFD